MNSIPIQVLFDSGATLSFVSLALSKRFSESSGMLDFPQEVDISDDRSVEALELFRDCVLRLYDECILWIWFPFHCVGTRLSSSWIC